MISTHLRGREQELALLESCLTAVDEGRGRVVLLAGEAGLGKTSLALEALRRSGHTPLSGRARLDVTTPYGPLASVLRETQRQAPERTSALSPYLALLLPELGPGPQDAGPEVLVEAILEALIEASRRQTTLLFLEDLQWADNATLELLPLLAERIGQERLLVLATYRSDEIDRGHPLRRTRQELRRTQNVEEIDIAPLPRDTTAALLEHTLQATPHPELVTRVHERTQGVPLYVEELARALQSSHRLQVDTDGQATLTGDDLPLPESVRDSVLLRLDALSEAARQTLDIASLIGREFDLELVTSLADDENSLGELTKNNLVRETGGNQGVFQHALIREVIRNEIAWSQRRSLSRRIATFLERQGAAPEVVVEHWLVARELEPAVQALLEVAERSCRLHAYQDAAAAAHRALENWPDTLDESKRIDTLQRLAHCAQIGGQLGDAIKALREAASSPLVQSDDGRRAAILRDLATVLGLQGAHEQALTHHRQAAELFEGAALPGDASAAWLAVAGAQTGASALESALQTLDHAEQLALQAKRQDLVVRARGFSGNVLAMRGQFERGRDLAQQALSLALEHGESEAAAEAYRRLASVLDYSSDFVGAREAYATAINYCRTQGDDPNRTACLGCMSAIVYRTGEWKQSLEIVKELTGDDDIPVGSRAIGFAIGGLIHANRGEVRGARRQLQNGMSLAQSKNLMVVELIAQFGTAVLAELEEDHAAATAIHESILEKWRQTQDTHDLVPVFLWQATYFQRRGDVAATTHRAEVLTQLASATGNVENVATLAHALGEVALLSGDHDKAIEHFEQARQGIESLEIPLEQAVVAWRSGHALAVAGRQSDAAPHLQHAYRLFKRLGARPFAAWVREEVEALGDAVEEGRSPDAQAQADRGGLTRRQVEIVRLLAQGFTNKEMAQRLFLSTRTVDMHVSNILDRLDCAGRTEAAQKAASLGLLDAAGD